MTLRAVWVLHRDDMLRTRDYLPMVPVVIFFSLASQREISQPSELPGWTLVNLASLAVTGGVFWLARVLIRRTSQETVTLLTLMGIGAALGAIKGSTTGAFGVTAGLEPDLLVAVMSRLLQAVLLGAVVVAGVSIAAQARYLLSEHRRVAVAAALAEKLNTLHHFEEIDAPLIRQALTHTRSALATAPRDPATLREVADSVVRPLSHELWQRQRRIAPAITLRSVYWRALQKKTFAPWVVGAIWWITVFPALAQRGDPLAVFAMTAGVVCALGAVLWGVSRLPISSAAAVIGLVGTGFALVIGASAVLGQMLRLSSYPGESPWELVALWLWALIITIGVTTIQAVATVQKDSTTRLAALLTEKDISPLTAQSLEDLVSKRLATFLHGEVVNKLLLLAKKSSDRDRESSHLASTTTAELLRQLDSAAWLTGARQEVGTVADRLAELADSWRGIIDVSVTPPRRPIALDPLDEANVMEALSEAVSNAYRHGLASAITLTVGQNSEGVITVEAADNGVGPRGGNRGVGSGIYDQATSGQWTLTAHPEGTGSLLQLTLPSPRAAVTGARLTSE